MLYLYIIYICILIYIYILINIITLQRNNADETLSLNDDQASKEAPEEAKDDSKITATTPIRKKLEFTDENNALPNNEINM